MKYYCFVIIKEFVVEEFVVRVFHCTSVAILLICLCMYICVCTCIMHEGSYAVQFMERVT